MRVGEARTFYGPPFPPALPVRDRAPMTADTVAREVTRGIGQGAIPPMALRPVIPLDAFRIDPEAADRIRTTLGPVAASIAGAFAPIAPPVRPKRVRVSSLGWRGWEVSAGRFTLVLDLGHWVVGFGCRQEAVYVCPLPCVAISFDRIGD